MARRPLAQLDGWELVSRDQDLRGQVLWTREGRPIGTIAEMIVDTDTERVDALVLDSGAEYSLRDVQLFGHKVVLIEPGQAPGAVMGTPEVIELREEELLVEKRPVQIGTVELHKEVVAERKTVEVPVLREEVIVEHQPTERHPADRPIEEGEPIVISLHEEELHVEKVPMVIEQVTIGKRTVEETEQVSTTVHREELAIDTEGEATVSGDTGLASEDAPPGKRQPHPY